MTEKIVVFSNCGSEDEARRVAKALVESHTAACVNIIPNIRSIYRWQGTLHDEAEWMLVIKSTRALFERLSIELRRVHSYETPEVIALPIVAGAGDYLDWIDRETSGGDNF
jgi:periplasmic divalent cation tolerance protein